MKDFYFVAPEDTYVIYSETLSKAKTYNSVLISELKIHNSHKESVGYWTSNKDMLSNISLKYGIPLIENALVVPFWHSDFSLAHVKFIYKSKQRFEVISLGSSPAGWFNFIGVSKDFSMRDLNNKESRIVLYDRLLSALRTNDGLHAGVINKNNLEALFKITPKIALRGSSEFVDKFKQVEGFDIVVGEGPHSQIISDYLTKSFCYQELIGLDDRAIVPKAIEHLKSIPIYERQAFNAEFKKIFKQDLRNINPALFENFINEKIFVDKIKEFIKEKKVKFVRISESSPRGSEMEVSYLSNSGLLKETIIWNPEDLAMFVIKLAGKDLIDFSFSLGGIPASYYYDSETGMRFARSKIYNNLRDLIYVIFVGMSHEIF